MTVFGVRPQRTLRAAAGLTGVGLHSGAPVALRILPAAPDAGVRFRRTDVRDRNPEVLARWDAVSDTTLCTTVANEDGVKVATIEHLMAALAGAGVDNAVVELDAAEVPVGDGSSAPFMAALDEAGLIDQAAPRRAVRVLKRVEARDEAGAWCALEPADSFSIQFEIDFASRAVGRRRASFELGREGAFRRELAHARTFGFERDVQRLRDMGLARGGSLDNAVVIGADDRILNAEGLRFDDEFIRHKALDSVGDLYLAGAPIVGRFVGVRSGHTLNNRLLRALFADAAAWRLVKERRGPAYAARGAAAAVAAATA
jgi:UDP-3-O-[3-hydroxymyristoyl] N-acetylglucosamine deacetylase